MPALGGRYPDELHDRPLRLRLYMGSESPRQGFFREQAMLESLRIREFLHPDGSGRVDRAYLPPMHGFEQRRDPTFLRILESPPARLGTDWPV